MIAAHREGRRLLLPTSGTTSGAPRVVVRTTASWWHSFAAYGELTGVSAGARLWVPGPLTATMNLFAAVHARAGGAVLADDPGEATHACLTPAQLDRLGHRLPAGAAVVVAGDRLPTALAERAERANLRISHYYGAAELSFVAAGRSADDLGAFPGVRIELREDVIWVRSPYLCEGYAGGTAGPLLRDGDWATVGDTGRWDGDRLVVLGRPDHVVTAGASVSLAAVEAELATAAAAPMAVCGLPHPTLGSVLTAVLTDPADREPVRAHARDHLPPALRPRRWHVLPTLPMTPAGKLDRLALAQAVADPRAVSDE